MCLYIYIKNVWIYTFHTYTHARTYTHTPVMDRLPSTAKRPHATWEPALRLHIVSMAGQDTGSCSWSGLELFHFVIYC